MTWSIEYAPREIMYIGYAYTVKLIEQTCSKQKIAQIKYSTN